MAHEALFPILGNDRLRARLWRAADEDRLHHCYLFEGPTGVGKAATALRLALHVNCLAARRPCWDGSPLCASCRQVLAGVHPDVIAVGPDPGRITRIITAAQARELIGALQLQRHSARRRFVIIDPADALNEDAANILLKTLEEPPAGTQFVLVTSRVGSLLQTVRSRSQRVRFGPVPRADLETWLDERGLEPALAVEAMGSPGLALALAEGVAAERRELVAGLVGVVGQPLHRVFAFAEAATKKGEGAAGERAAAAVDALEEVLRDVVALAAGRAPVHAAHAERLGTWTTALWPGGVARLAAAIGLARERMQLNVNGRIVLEALLTAVNLELSQVKSA